MEVAQPDDVDPERLHGREIFELRVERSAGPEALRESQMEMVHERLVAVDGLEDVAMCEGKRRLPCRGRLSGSSIEVHRHALPGAGRSIVEREVLAVLSDSFAVGLPHPQR